MSDTVRHIKGTVSWCGGKDFDGNTLYSLRVDEYDEWFRCGRVNPNCRKGDQVEFDVIKSPKGKGEFVDADSVTVSKMEVSEEAARSPAVAKRTPAKGAGARDTYWSDKAVADADRQKQISYQAAWNTAIEFCKLSKDLDSLRPIGTKKDEKFDNLFGVVEDTAQKLWRMYLAAADGPSAESEAVAKAMKSKEEVKSVDSKIFE